MKKAPDISRAERPELLKNLEIVDLSPDGRGVGFSEKTAGTRGKAVFVSGALPGETVNCEVIRRKDSYLEAAAPKILSRAFRPEPVCENAGRCGGCPLGRAPCDLQLDWKEKIIRDAFARVGGFAKERFNAVWRGLRPAPRNVGYRDKMTFAFSGDQVPGLRERSSRRITPIDDCPMLPGCGEILALCREAIKAANPKPGFWRFLTLRKTSSGTWLLLFVTGPATKGETKKADEVCRKILRNPNVYAVAREERKNDDGVHRGQRRVFCENFAGRPDAAFTAPLGGREFKLDVASFFQVNPAAAEELAKIILAADDGGAGLLDLYCGVGAPGLLLAPRYDYALGVELDPASVKYCAENAGSLPYRCVAANAGDPPDLPEIKNKRWTTVLLDPPRGGTTRETAERIIALAPEKIIYVSCNPVTLARDAKILAPAYTPVSLEAVDMFPQTPGAECVCVFTKKPPAPPL